MKNIVTYSLGIVVIGLVVVFTLNINSSPSQNTEQNITTSAPITVNTSNGNQNRRYQLPANAVKNQQTLNTKIAPQQQVTSATPLISTTEKDASIQDGNTQKEIDDALKLIDGKSNKNISDVMKSTFNAESVDYEWSNIYEQKISHFFRETNEFSAFSPTSIECKSSRCKVTIVVTDNAQLEKTYKSITNSVEKNATGITKKTTFVVDESANSIDFYFARNTETNLYQ